MDIEIPNSLKETYSSKTIAIFTLESIRKVLNDNNTNCQILLLTSYGFIKCDIDFENESDSPLRKINDNAENTYALDLSCILKYTNESICEYEKENPSIKSRDNGTFLNLKNVTIYSNGLNDSIATPAVKINEFVIFVDQIIGFSLVPRIAD